MPPSLSPTIGTPAVARGAEQAVDQRLRAARASASKKPGLRISRSVARPQAVATGLPDSVPAW